MHPPSYDVLWRTVWGAMQRLGPVHRHILKNLVSTVSALDVRMNEAHKMGFTKMIAPKSQAQQKPPKGLEVMGVATVAECLALLY